MNLKKHKYFWKERKVKQKIKIGKLFYLKPKFNFYNFCYIKLLNLLNIPSYMNHIKLDYLIKYQILKTHSYLNINYKEIQNYHFIYV